MLLAVDDKDVEEVKAVLPESWEVRGVCPLPPGYGFMELTLEANVGAVWVRESVGP
jgi:hypothetical protein